MDGFVPETNLYSDDVRMVTEILRRDWSIGLENPLNIEYEPEQMMVNGRIGNIYVYHVSRENSISTVDYRTLRRQSKVAVRVANRFRENHYAWCDEVYRILMANRRPGIGPCGLHNYTYLEVTSDRHFTDLSGWYVTTFDVKLIGYAVPLHSAGFGDEANVEIAAANARAQSRVEPP